MNLRSPITFRNPFSRGSKPGKAERSFAAAASSRLNADWITSPLSADAAMRGKLTAIRSRSRDLERNNEWARGFLRTLENNVIGEMGIGLQMRVKDPGTGKFDEIANDKIETAWWQWGRKGKCTLCGRHTWRDLQRIVVRTIARDGEIVLRKVRTKAGLRIQIIEADLLDIDANFIASNGNEVRFGVEIDGNRAIVAYHLLGRHPGDHDFHSPRTQRIRVDAADIIHLFLTERVDQTRGLPWLVASMQGLRMLDGYAEAELVAARTGAAKMGFLTKKTPEGWDGEIDGDGNLSMDASPGTIEELPAGVEFKEWSNDHPNSGYGDFVKSRLRGVATSLGISYNSLASDLENVNYSSIRAGLLEEREVWKAIQRFLIEHMCEDIFSEWLSLELLSGRLGLPWEKMWKFDVPEFQGRRWAWVDPKKDMESNILAIRSGQTSLRKVVAEAGGDIYDVMSSQKADNELAASMGLTFPELTDAPKPAPVVAEIDTAA
jgi:lambda family phage portal protein